MRGRELEAAMRALAERQHGVLSRAQLRKLGASREALRSRVRSPAWQLVSPQVVRLAGSRQTFQQNCMAAVLDAGGSAVASHRTAAALWSLPGFAPDEVHVSRSRTGTSRPGRLATVHEPRLLPRHHRAALDGVPVTTVARTVFDLCGCLHPLRAERAIDNALARKLVGLETMRGVAIELLEHGRTGSALMRQLLSERGAGYIPPASGLEARFFAVLVEAGLELPDRQVDVGSEVWTGRVDFLYRRLHLVIEIDSDIHHTAKLDAESDRRRDEALRAGGFQVVRITGGQVWERPHEVLTTVRAALRGATAAA
jgi:hypothetical protein